MILGEALKKLKNAEVLKKELLPSVTPNIETFLHLAKQLKYRNKLYKGYVLKNQKFSNFNMTYMEIGRVS